MLILKRNIGESVLIKDNETGEIILEIQATSLKGNQIKLGFEADRDRYFIIRKEIADGTKPKPPGASY